MKERRNYLSRRLLSMLLVCVMCLTLMPEAFAESATAAAMRLMKTEGTVSIENSSGRSVTVRDDLRLYSGYGIDTGAASYAWINLDDAKLVKEDAVSEIAIRKSGKKLDILVESGNLYFNVKEPLDSDETFHIRTSTMAIGIRGTCGWVKVIDQWTSLVYILEGSVQVTVTDPVTGETKTETITGGEMAQCIVYPQDRAGDKCEIIHNAYTVDDIDGFVLVEAVPDSGLCDTIYQDSGLDLRNWQENPAERLAQDQTDVHERLAAIEQQVSSQDSNISTTPVWANPSADSADTSDAPVLSTTGGSSRPAGQIITLTMPQTAAAVNEILGRDNVRQVVLQPGTRARTSTATLLDVDSALSVPSGKILTLQSGVALTAEEGQLLAVHGTLTVGGDFRLSGDLAAGSSGVIKSTAFKLAASVVNWKVSDTTDSTGYYTLTYSPQGVYTITYDPNGGDWPQTTAKTDSNGRISTFPDAQRTGYTFDGWFTSPTGGTEITTDYVFTRDTTVYAHWTAAGSRHTITFNPTGGTVTPTSSITDADGRLSSTAEIPDIPADATRFDGNFYKIYPTTLNWEDAKAYCEQLGGHLAAVTSAEEQSFLDSLNANSARLWIGGYRDDNFNWFWVTGEPWGYTNWAAGEPNDSSNVVSNENRTALWPSQWNDLSENNLSEQSGFVCEWEVGAVLPTPTRDGYTFNGWFTDAAGGTRITTATVFTRDTTIYAHWTQVAVIVRFNANGGTVSPSVYVPGMDGKVGNLPTPTREGYTFAGWFTTATGGTQITTDTVFEQSTTVYAHWTEVSTSGVTWRYDQPTKTLYIMGSGAMENYDFATGTGGSSAPWAAEATEIQSLVIEDGVTGIGNYAFYECRSLTSATIPASVTSIGEFAFYGCRGLTSVTIPDGVTSIGRYAFTFCSGLTSVTIPASVTSINRYAFGGCTALADVYYGGTRAQWNAVTIGTYNDPLLNATIHCTDDSAEEIGGEAGENVRWSYDPITKTLRISGTGPMEDYSMIRQDGTYVTSAPWSDYSSEMNNLVIEQGVTSIGQYAFYSCSGLTNISISDSVTSIAQVAFAECVGLRSVAIPSGVTTIGRTAFGTCTSLTSITIPNSVTSIGYAAFSDCRSLTSVTIPDSVIAIEDGTFSSCSDLTNITIPASVASIGIQAFYNCNSLTDVYYTGTETQWNAITIDTTNNDPLLNATKHYNSTARSAVSYTAPGYTDIPAGAWYAEAADYCRENNLMNGTSDTTFSPDGTLTRAMMVTVLHRLAGAPAAASAVSFTDVEAGKWYTEAVSWANGKGIVLGYNETTFGPNDPVTHEQVALIFQRYSGNPNVETVGADTPKAPATRAEIAVTLMNYAKGGASMTLTPGTLSTFSAMNIMCGPSGIALDSSGSLLISDLYHKQVWRVLNRDSQRYAGSATVQDLYGQPVGGYNDATLEGSYFKEPWAIAPFLGGWAVSDTANNVVRLIQASGVQTLNGATKEKLTVTALGVAFDHPTGLAADSDGNLYVSDTFNGAVRRVTPQGGVSTVAKDLSEPTGLCWKDGVLYIAETGKNRVVKVQDGKVVNVAGNGNEGLFNAAAGRSTFSAPQGVAVGDDGSVYIADTGNSAIRRVKDGSVTTLAVRETEQLNGGLTSPTGLLVQDGRLYICDSFARTVFVYQL